MSCSLMQIEAQNWKDFSVAISQTPRDDAMRCSMPSEVKTPNDFLLLWKKTFLKIKQNFRGHQLRIVWWNPLACKRRWAPQMLNIHKCSKSQLIWDIIKISVRVIPLLFFNFWIFAPKKNRDRVQGYEWLSIFGKTSFPAMLKNQSFWPIASAFFCKLTKLLNANPSSPWVLQNLASSCVYFLETRRPCLFDHGLLEHLLVVCCFRWNTAVKDKSIVLEKDTFWHSSF